MTLTPERLAEIEAYPFCANADEIFALVAAAKANAELRAELEQARDERDAARAAVVKLGDSARKTIDDLDAAYALLQECAPMLYSTCGDLRSRIEAMVGEK